MIKNDKRISGWKIVSICAIAALGSGIWDAPCHAQDSEEDLAKKAQNPIANLISLPLQNNTSFNIGPYNRTANVLNIQPVAPFYEGRLITRTILPIVTPGPWVVGVLCNNVWSYAGDTDSPDVN